MTILFFDSDARLKQHAKKYLQINSDCEFFNTTLNTTSKTKLEPFLNSEIISVFTHSETLSNKKLDLFPNLKLIATRSTGFNHIDLDYCKKRGIEVVNVPRYGEVTVAEFAFGLMLNLARKIICAEHDMKHNRVDVSNYMGFDLSGKTIGVVGTGSIGQHMIKIAQGFGMNVIAYDLYPKPELKKLYAKNLDSLFKKSDIISLHVPSTPENIHLLDEKAFAKMKRGVIIINTARGDLIDTQALYQALRDGQVGGAGLDVLENEDFLVHDEIMTSTRLKDNEFLLDSAMNLKLMQFDNVIATPHIAFNTKDAIDRINDTTFDNIKNFLKGKVINSVIRK